MALTIDANSWQLPPQYIHTTPVRKNFNQTEDHFYPHVYAADGSVEETIVKSRKAKAKTWQPEGSFPFIRLPPELRLRILALALLVPRTIDLDPTNTRRIAPRLDLLQTSRALCAEATHVFYAGHAFRLFPTHGRFFHTKTPLLARLPVRLRHEIRTVELRLGPGWSSPPRGWRVFEPDPTRIISAGGAGGVPRQKDVPSAEHGTPPVWITDLTNLRTVRVFIECDPSDDVFRGFRVDSDFYTRFTSRILRGVLEACPTVQIVEFDAYPSVTREGPLMKALMGIASERGKRLGWGPLRGWGGGEIRDAGEEDDGIKESVEVGLVETFPGLHI